MQPVRFGGWGRWARMLDPRRRVGLRFDHILCQLQDELQKSREMRDELHNVSAAISDIHNTLGGTLVSSIIIYLFIYLF
jgi:hypothetical protein